MIQEQLNKIEKDFDERFSESEFCFGIGKIRRQEIADFLRTSAIELVKSVVEGEKRKLEQEIWKYHKFNNVWLAKNSISKELETELNEMFMRAHNFPLSSSIASLQEIINEIK